VSTGLVREDDLALRQQLIERITACWSTQALRVAVELNLPDLLHEGPADAPSLASRCGCDGDALRRLLQALCTLDVCEERSDGRFEKSCYTSILHVACQVHRRILSLPAIHFSTSGPSSIQHGS